MASHRVTLQVAAAADTYQQGLKAQSRKGKTLNALTNLLQGLMLGSHRGGQIDIGLDDGTGGISANQIVTYASSSGSQTIAIGVPAGIASGVWQVASGSGVETAVIGGRTVNVTWAVSDANTADLMAAAINVDAVALTYVKAWARVASQTLTISGGSGVLTAVIGGFSVSVTWASSDTATATALALAINQKAYIPVIASSSAGVVTVYAMVAGATGNAITSTASGTGITAGAAALAGGGTNANVLVQSLSSGAAGLGTTLTASGTGASILTGANLVGGLNAQVATVTFTAGATDTLTAAVAAAAINADATFSRFARATSAAAILTISANCLPRAAELGNGTTLVVTGTGAFPGDGELTNGTSSTDAGYVV